MQFSGCVELGGGYEDQKAFYPLVFSSVLTGTSRSTQYHQFQSSSFSVIMCWNGFGFNFLGFSKSGVGKFSLQAKSGLPTKNSFCILVKGLIKEKYRGKRERRGKREVGGGGHGGGMWLAKPRIFMI